MGRFSDSRICTRCCLPGFPNQWLNLANGFPLTAAGPFGSFTQFPFTLYPYRHPLAYRTRTVLIVARSDFLVNSLGSFSFYPRGSPITGSGNFSVSSRYLSTNLVGNSQFYKSQGTIFSVPQHKVGISLWKYHIFLEFTENFLDSMEIFCLPPAHKKSFLHFPHTLLQIRWSFS